MSTQPNVPYTILLPPVDDKHDGGNNKNWRELKKIYEQLARFLNGITSTIVTGVSSVFGRTGNVIAVGGDYNVSQVTGAAPLASPGFTGIPMAPTAAPGTNTTQLATTAFVQAAIPAPLRFADNETPTGAIDGVNTTFVLAHVPSPLASLQFYWKPSAGTSRLLIRGGGNDYTISGVNITTLFVPAVGDLLFAFYRY